jgi:hypothetical protein
LSDSIYTFINSAVLPILMYVSCAYFIAPYEYIRWDIRQHMSAVATDYMSDVSIRQHTSAYVSRCYGFRRRPHVSKGQHTSAYVRCQLTTAYVSISLLRNSAAALCQHTSAYISKWQHAWAYRCYGILRRPYARIRQHMSACVSIPLLRNSAAALERFATSALSSRRTYIYIYVHTHTYIHICIWEVRYVCLVQPSHLYIYIYTHTHIYIHIYIYIWEVRCVWLVQPSHLYMHLYIYTHTHTHTHTHIRTYTIIIN